LLNATLAIFWIICCASLRFHHEFCKLGNVTY